MFASHEPIEIRTRSSRRIHVLDVFAEYLAEAFEMPVEQALDEINRQLAANPLTSDIQLTVDPWGKPNA
jgi:hypothetical protein